MFKVIKEISFQNSVFLWSPLSKKCPGLLGKVGQIVKSFVWDEMKGVYYSYKSKDVPDLLYNQFNELTLIELLSNSIFTELWSISFLFVCLF